MFNLSFNTGIFSGLLKISKLMLIHKKDLKLIVSNYKSIFLLSNLVNVPEKLVYKDKHEMTQAFLEEKKILYYRQFGFQKKLSTAHAIIDLIENTQKACDDKTFGCGYFSDLEIVFDSSWWQSVPEKLTHYGIWGGWCKPYLANHCQFASINGFDSNYKAVNCDVAQGSAVFVVSTYHWPKSYNNAVESKMFHFANTTGLHNEEDSIKEANNFFNKEC